MAITRARCLELPKECWSRRNTARCEDKLECARSCLEELSTWCSCLYDAALITPSARDGMHRHSVMACPIHAQPPLSFPSGPRPSGCRPPESLGTRSGVTNHLSSLARRLRRIGNACTILIRYSTLSSAHVP